MGLELFVHDRNYGYGANQKTATARRSARARISSSWSTRLSIRPYSSTQRHPPIQEGKATSFWGRACSATAPMRQGMPWWKYYSNRFLTGLENMAFGLNLSEYHTVYALPPRGAGGREPADEFG